MWRRERCVRQSNVGIRGVFRRNKTVRKGQFSVKWHLKLLRNISARATFDSERLSSPGRSFFHSSPSLTPVRCIPLWGSAVCWLSVLTALWTNCTHGRTQNNVVDHWKTKKQINALIGPIVSSASQVSSTQKTAALVCCYEAQEEKGPFTMHIKSTASERKIAVSLDFHWHGSTQVWQTLTLKANNNCF